MFDPSENIDATKKELLVQYTTLLENYTRKLNLISPKTIKHIDERHIEHCLVLAQKAFPKGCTVVDWGTGGGLPAIPLAIVFPEIKVVAVDAVGKKILAVNAMGRQLGLKNLEGWHGRAEAWDGKLHYSVSRATAPLTQLWSWHKRAVSDFKHDQKETWKPGLICLKGGDLTEEIATLEANYPSLQATKSPLDKILRASFFKEKYILHICDTLE